MAFTDYGNFDALGLAEKSFPEFAKVPTQLVTLKLAAAGVYHKQMKDFTQASKLYKALLEDHRRLEHPALRVASPLIGCAREQAFREVGRSGDEPAVEQAQHRAQVVRRY